MPFPMVHLYVARALAEKWPHVYGPDFFLGVLAPDAYVMRAQRDPGDRALAHLEGGNPEAWHANILRWIEDPAGPCGTRFGLGYAAHLLTDWSWQAHVLTRYGNENERMSAEQRKAYVQDMTALDLTLYREETGLCAELWPLLAEAAGQGLPGLVSAREVDLERERTLTWYAPRAAQPEPSVCLEAWRPFLDAACRASMDGLCPRAAASGGVIPRGGAG